MLVNVCGVDLEDQLSGETCVHFAARYGSDDALRCFVEAGANVDAVDKDGRTALHFVCDSERAIVLLAAGADVHVLNSRGDTPLQSLFSIERNDDLPIMHALLAGGADLDAPSASGVTVRQLLGGAIWRIDPAEVESARSRIASLRLDFVRRRALQVCIGLQPLQLAADVRDSATGVQTDGALDRVSSVVGNCNDSKTFQKGNSLTTDRIAEQRLHHSVNTHIMHEQR